MCNRLNGTPRRAPIVRCPGARLTDTEKNVPILINYSDQDQTITQPTPLRPVLTQGTVTDKEILGVHDVAVFERRDP